MSRRVIIPIVDDGSVISSSPLTLMDTLYYETLYNIQGNANQTQQIDRPPLNEYSVASPAGTYPCIVIRNLPVDTDYEFTITRYNSLNENVGTTSGTFNTGS